MSAILSFLAWEWVNIALEFAATAWVRLPRWILAVIGVNLATHPIFTVLLVTFGRSTAFVLSCEVVIICVEALLLMATYGFRRWRRLLLVSFLMNAASYLTGVLIAL